MNVTYFVHSITEDNEKGLATGWLPGTLSTEGTARAKDVSRRLKDQRFDAVFSSDLTRAVQSTQLFFNGLFLCFSTGGYANVITAILTEHQPYGLKRTAR